MARSNGIDSLTLKELLELEKSIAAAIVERKRTGLTETRARMAEIAAEAGFSLDDIFTKSNGGKSPKSPVAIKFRNPDNPAETWTGRGRQPRWLVAKLAKRGVSVDDFRI